MMQTCSKKLSERFLDLAWSLWTGLGVPGSPDNHYNHAIDIEALIVFTAALGDTDPRLRDETTDWCIRYGSLVSGTRLRNILVRENGRVKANFGEFAATVAEHSSLRWPGRTKSRKYEPRKRLKIKSFNRSSQITLRLRAIFGVGARAEIICAFLANPLSAFRVLDLATSIKYSKRNVAQILEALKSGDLLESFSIQNQIHYRLPRERLNQLRKQLEPVPEIFIQWSFVLYVLGTAMELVKKVESKKENIQAIEAKAFITNLKKENYMNWLPMPAKNIFGSEYWKEFLGWLMKIVDILADGKAPK